MRYGLGDWEDTYTREEVAEVEGVSVSRVRREFDKAREILSAPEHKARIIHILS